MCLEPAQFGTGSAEELSPAKQWRVHISVSGLGIRHLLPERLSLPFQVVFPYPTQESFREQAFRVFLSRSGPPPDSVFPEAKATRNRNPPDSGTESDRFYYRLECTLSGESPIVCSLSLPQTQDVCLSASRPSGQYRFFPNSYACCRCGVLSICGFPLVSPQPPARNIPMSWKPM